MEDPRVAQQQIDDERRASNAGGNTGGGGPTDGTTTGGRAPTGGTTGGETAGGSGSSSGGGRATRATRFHATKTLDPTRSVRDISQISDEILALFTTNGAPIQITVDIESTALAKLTPEQVTALQENLNTLGFTEWNVE